MNTANDQGAAYEAQCNTMLANAKAWRAAHPDSQARVQFNFPKTVSIIGCISDALNSKYVSANEQGVELIKALWPWGGRDEPTVLMVRMVLEHEG